MRSLCNAIVVVAGRHLYGFVLLIKEKNEVFLLTRYGGHIHQLRFRQGHTYGEETHLLSKEYPRLKRVKSEGAVANHSDPYVSREFPDGLIPGYAGNSGSFSV